VRPCIYRLLANGYLEAGESFSGRAVYRATAKGRAAISRPPES
jgi:DNA-binding PadR family transcriptional regulator